MLLPTCMRETEQDNIGVNAVRPTRCRTLGPLYAGYGDSDSDNDSVL